MKIMKEFQEWLFSVRTANKVAKQDKMTDQEKRQLKRDERQVTMIDLTYDKYNDEYHMHINTKRKGREIRDGSVHVTAKKNTYLWTDLWDELIWPQAGQSATHMYLWMINTKINPDAISEKRHGADFDYKKLLMYGALAVVIIIVAWMFIPKG